LGDEFYTGAGWKVSESVQVPAISMAVLFRER
jgi:hypothetical protein